jgi:hypothetical protein
MPTQHIVAHLSPCSDNILAYQFITTRDCGVSKV